MRIRVYVCNDFDVQSALNDTEDYAAALKEANEALTLLTKLHGSSNKDVAAALALKGVRTTCVVCLIKLLPSRVGRPAPVLVRTMCRRCCVSWTVSVMRCLS